MFVGEMHAGSRSKLLFYQRSRCFLRQMFLFWWSGACRSLVLDLTWVWVNRRALEQDGGGAVA